MIVLRETSAAFALSARVSGTGVKPGMLVKLVQGAASGEQPKVQKAAKADIQDPTVDLGIVQYAMEDSQDVDFTVSLTDGSLTPVDNEIPDGAQVAVWFGILTIAYHESVLPTALKPSTVREPAKVAFDPATGFPAAYNNAATDGTEVIKGFVYRIDGPEVTMVINTNHPQVDKTA